MKKRKLLLGIISCAVVLLATAVSSQGQAMYQVWDEHEVWNETKMAPVVSKVYSELEYRDGFPGHRFYKRQQVKRLQCMLNYLGYCTGSIDGWYGNSTSGAIRCYLSSKGENPGYGQVVSWRQWRELEYQAGGACSQYSMY